MKRSAFRLAVCALSLIAARGAAQDCCDICGEAGAECWCLQPKRYFSIGGATAFEQFDSFTADGRIYDFDNGSSLQFKLGRRLYPELAAEIQFEYSVGHDIETRGVLTNGYPATITLDEGVSTWSVTANAKLSVPNPVFQPYLVAGIGALSGSVSAPGLIEVDETGPVVRAGAGFDFLLGPKWFLSMDVAYMLPLDGAEFFEHITFGSGFGWRF